MFTINDRNVEDILKENDIIEKFREVHYLLYEFFRESFGYEKGNMRRWLHFSEALTLYIVINSNYRSTVLCDITKSLHLFRRHEVHKHDLTNGKVHYVIRDAVDTEKEILSEYHDILLNELKMYGKVFKKGIPCGFVYKTYWYDTLVATMLHALQSFNGNIKYELNTIAYLYNFCCEYSPLYDIPISQQKELFLDTILLHI